LPKWWLYVFYATVVFSIVWSVLYPSVPGLNSYFAGVLGYTQRDEVAADIARAAAGQAAFRQKIRELDVAAVKADPELNRFSVAGGRVLFAENCAACHQAGGTGAPGYPSLADDDWLWGGTPADIEHTISVGIRGQHDETRQSQMPRFLADGMLTAPEVEAVVDHVLSLTGKAPANEKGAQIFAEQCASCHGEDGSGNRELGAPNLADQIWLYGGDRAAVRQTVAYSRNGVMPAWAGRLDEASIRMLAVYVHALGGGE